jgi:hypothetical protein
MKRGQDKGGRKREYVGRRRGVRLDLLTFERQHPRSGSPKSATRDQWSPPRHFTSA